MFVVYTTILRSRILILQTFWSLLCFQRKICLWLKHFSNARNTISVRFRYVFIILLCLLFPFFSLKILHTIFECFVLIKLDLVYVNSARFKHIDCSCHFLVLKMEGFSLSFLKSAQLLIDGDIQVKSRAYIKWF